MAIDAVYNEGVKILYRSVKFLYTAQMHIYT